MAAGFDEVPAFGASVRARVHTSGQVLFARGFQAVKIIVCRAKDRGTAKNGAEWHRRCGKGGGREKTVPRIRMASYVSYKEKIVLAPFRCGGIDEAKGLLFVASRRVTERDTAAASAPLV